MPRQGNRIIAALRQGEDGPVRAYCAELAERIALPVYQAAYPDDPRPVAILWTAKRFAAQADDMERLAMHRVARVWCEQVSPWESRSETPAAHACQTIGFCLEKPVWCEYSDPSVLLGSTNRCGSLQCGIGSHSPYHC
jgi:hypothetical protein